MNDCTNREDKKVEGCNDADTDDVKGKRQVSDKKTAFTFKV